MYSNIETVIVNRQNYKNIPVSSSDVRKMIVSGKTEMAAELLPFGYTLDLSKTEISSDSDISYVEKSIINQLLPESGSFNFNIYFENITSEKEVFIDNTIIKWFNK